MIARADWLRAFLCDMAKVTEELKGRILADFHIGKTQNALSKKYDLSPATINKICKGLVPQHIDTVNTLVRVKTELSEKSECEVNAIHQEVNERTKHIAFFTNATVKNISLMMGKVSNETSIYDHRQVQETILKGKETVLGKEQPTTAVQVNVDNRTITRRIVDPAIEVETDGP